MSKLNKNDIKKALGDFNFYIEIEDVRLLKDLYLAEYEFKNRLSFFKGRDLEKTKHCLDIINQLKKTKMIYVGSIPRLLGQTSDKKLFKKLLKYSNKVLANYELEITDLGPVITISHKDSPIKDLLKKEVA